MQLGMLKVWSWDAIVQVGQCLIVPSPSYFYSISPSSMPIRIQGNEADAVIVDFSDDGYPPAHA